MNDNKLNNSWIQIAFQIILFGSVWIISPLLNNDFSLSSYDFRRSMQNIIGIAIIVILNIKWLLPNFYFKNKKTKYVLFSSLIVLVTYAILRHLVMSPLVLEPMEIKPNRPDPSTFVWFRELYRISPIVLAILGSSLFEISRFANKQQKEAVQLKNEKLEAEVQLLKSKVNPHFLFNALNNLYSLSYLKPEQTPENILKLSNMLRYMLYECNEDRVPLEKEISYLEDYINLQLLKDSRGMNVKTDFGSANPKIQIAPMLLIPFVENAFKHSHIEDLENGWIELRLSTSSNQIDFKIENSLNEKNYQKDKVGGIGLPSAKRLLQLHYPNKHQLVIDKTDKQYSVKLEIKTA